MSIMIVPEPLFDSNVAVEAYWLRSHDGKRILGLQDNFFKMDDAFTNAGLDIVEKIGLEPFIGDKVLFVELTRTQLMIGIPMNMKLDGSKLVCVVPAELTADKEAAETIRILGAHGYQIALDGVPETADPGVLQFVKFILLDYKHPQFPNLHAKVKSEMRDKKVVIFNVPHTEAFNNLRQNYNTYFAGGFYSQPITSGDAELSPVKVNILHLLNQVNQEDFELSDIVQIIERDPYLSISLLRFINSSVSGLKKKVESIMQAVAILGQNAVRQWAMVALSVSLAEDRPSEITRLALIRAKFAEGLAAAFELGVLQQGLFMSGLFSLLDVILEKPIDVAIDEIAVDERVRAVLVEKSGPFASVMELIYAYERADWDKVSILMIQNNTDMEAVSRAYLEAVLWYRKLLKSIDESADGEESN